MKRRSLANVNAAAWLDAAHHPLPTCVAQHASHLQQAHRKEAIQDTGDRVRAPIEAQGSAIIAVTKRLGRTNQKIASRIGS